MKKTTIIEEENSIPKTRLWEDFNAEFGSAAGTRDAPSRPNKFKVVGQVFTKNIQEEMERDIRVTAMAQGLVCVSGFSVTSARLLIPSAITSALVLAQKWKPTEGVSGLYENIRCFFRRGDLPGNIMSHLVRRDRQDDHGVLDGVRFLGNLQQTIVKEQNSVNPYFHTKSIVLLVPGKNEKLVSYAAWFGGANPSFNSQGSLEMMTRSDDPKTVMHLFEDFSWLWSLSEGRHNLSLGMQPTYWWEKKAQRFSNPPKCPKPCGASQYYSVWISPDKGSLGPAYRVLKCAKCGKTVPFLEEHQPVK
jgi:hypothetical protein